MILVPASTGRQNNSRQIFDSPVHQADTQLTSGSSDCRHIEEEASHIS